MLQELKVHKFHIYLLLSSRLSFLLAAHLMVLAILQTGLVSSHTSKEEVTSVRSNKMTRWKAKLYLKIKSKYLVQCWSKLPHPISTKLKITYIAGLGEFTTCQWLQHVWPNLICYQAYPPLPVSHISRYDLPINNYTRKFIHLYIGIIFVKSLLSEDSLLDDRSSHNTSRTKVILSAFEAIIKNSELKQALLLKSSTSYNAQSLLLRLTLPVRSPRLWLWIDSYCQTLHQSHIPCLILTTSQVTLSQSANTSPFHVPC